MKMPLTPIHIPLPRPCAASVDLREILRLSLGGLLPPGGGLDHWLDRLEAGQ